MSWLSSVAYQLKAWFLRKDLDAGLAEEVKVHVEMAAEANEAAGMAPAEAREAALREFGNVAGIQERAREVRSGRSGVWLEQLSKDVGFAVRALRRSPGFTAVAVVTVAVGIGAGTAVFSLVNGILLRALPVPNPQELRVLEWTGRERTMPLSGSFEAIDAGKAESSTNFQRKAIRADVFSRTQAVRADAFSKPLYEQLRQAAGEVADLVAFGTVNGLNVQVGEQAVTAQGLFVSGNFMADLGVRLAVGRGLLPEDDRPEAPPVVLISYEWWQGYFGGDPAVVHRTLRINEKTFSIVGVTAKGFRGAHPGDRSDLYATCAGAALVDRVYAGPLNGQELWWLQVMARLKPSGSNEQLLAAAQGLFAAEAGAVMQEPLLRVRDGRAGPDWVRQDYRGPLQVLLAVVGIVLLVSCANLAGLCLARAEARRHEFAVRAALGSARGRLVRVALLENGLIALTGAALGGGGAWLARHGLSALAAGDEAGLRYDTSIDARVVGCSIAAALATALLSGALPGWRAAQADPLDALKQGGLRAARGGVARTLVAMQAGLALVLVVGGGVYGRSLLGLLHTDAGYTLENRFVFRLKASGNVRAKWREVHARIQEELSRVPGVEATGLASFKPMLGTAIRQDFFIPPGADRPAIDGAVRCWVDARFFQVMDLRLLEGRLVQPADGFDKGATVVVVNQSFAWRYLPAGQAVGQVLRAASGNATWRVIGVCRDQHLGGVKGPVPPTVFFFTEQAALASFYHVVLSSRTEAELTRIARAAVAAVDPELPIGGPAMLDGVRDKALRQERLMALLVGSLGVVSFGLAVLGLYGLTSFTVTRRRREIGVRMALGARPAEIGRAVLTDAVRLVGLGMAAGVLAVLFLGRLIESQLYGVSVRDPGVIAGAIGVLVLGALVAAWVPAWRAARVNPLVALRAE